MELDVEQQQIGLELRDGEAMEVKFALIDLKSSQLWWDDLSFEEGGWWTGLSGLHRGYMLFYTYEDQQNPELKNAFALEVSDREVCWAYSGYNHLVFLEGNTVGFSKQEEERFYSRIDLVSGELESLSDEEGLYLLEEGKEAVRKQGAKNSFPVQYLEGSPYFATVKDFLFEHFNVEAQKACEYLEIFDKIIISYYTANSGKLINFILVCDEAEANPLLHEQLDQAAEGIALDTFFVSDRKLIFTKEKRTIECYEI